MELDFLVVGGGPAGSACASRLAQQGARVAIVERSDFKSFRVGETIHSGIQPLLQRIVFQPNEQEAWRTPSRGVASMWGSDEPTLRPTIMNPYGRGWCVDRRLFDEVLFKHAGKSGVRLFANSRVLSASRKPNYWRFVIDSQNKVFSGRANFVVEATGRTGASCFAPQASRIWVDKLIGVAFLSNSENMFRSHFPQSVLIEAVSHGWWYSVVLPSNRLLAVYFTDADLLPRVKAKMVTFLEEQLKMAKTTLELCSFIQKSLSQLRWRVYDARSSTRRIASSDGWIATGDSLMSFDPLCGRGVVEAINSGIETAEWLLSGHLSTAKSIPDWIEKAKNRFNEYMRERLQIYSFELRWKDSVFWQRRSALDTV